MQTPITKDNISDFAYTNRNEIRSAPRGIVLEFHGLGDGNRMIKEKLKLGTYCAEHNLLYAIPYYGPWAWMNDKAVKYVDEVVDGLEDEFASDLPVISTGLSMGGLGSLVYPVYTRHKVIKVASICPVCDLAYHYTEREDTARTIYGAYSHYDMTLEEAIKIQSPMELLDKMPRIPYRLFLCTADEEVNIDKHGLTMVSLMKSKGFDIEKFICPDRPHCDLDENALREYRSFIVD